MQRTLQTILIAQALLVLLCCPAWSQSIPPALQAEMDPYLEQLLPDQQKAFEAFFTLLAKVDTAQPAELSQAGPAWGRVKSSLTRASVSPERLTAFAYLELLAYKTVVEQFGYGIAQAYAPMIFRDGVNLRDSLGRVDYETWATLCRMEDYQLKMYTTLYGWDNAAGAMAAQMEAYLSKSPAEFQTRYRAEVGGGICPTFIQPPPGGRADRMVPAGLDRALYAAIAIPTDGCLLRSDIPIFGIAGGRDFKSFRVEYGKGKNPREWSTIAASDSPREALSLSRLPSLLQGDMDIRGNLATWNVGLKNWEHLPWHPASDTTDLNGIYTIRLTVAGRTGRTAEDRVTCEVGRAIAQCLPGIAVSADRNVTLRFAEQSLTAPFRLFSIRPATSEAPPPPAGQKPVGDVYLIREGGDRFIKPVTLEMAYPPGFPPGAPAGRLGIFMYDSSLHSWVLLKTVRDEARSVLQTELTALPAPRALFAVLANSGELTQSLPPAPQPVPARRQKASEDAWVKDDFEADLGEWSGRDGEYGASVARILSKEKNTNHYVEIRGRSADGDFACNLVTSSFDARDYPAVDFEYRVDKDAKADFYVRVGGRWYDIGFTGEVNTYRYKDVNISHLGQIPGILADGFWHRTRFDLGQFLRRRTRNTRVDAIVLAHWKVGGYMKLEFGGSPAGAAICFDNFTIARDTASRRTAPSEPPILVDDFESDARSNYLLGSRSVFSSPGAGYCSAELTDRRGPDPAGPSTGRCLLVRYGTKQGEGYAGWLTTLEGTDISACTHLRFEIHAGDSVPPCLIGLRGEEGEEAKVPLEPWCGKPGAGAWRTVTIPLRAFSRLSSLARMENLSLSFDGKLGSASGQLEIDNIEFVRNAGETPLILVDDFGLTPPGVNALGGGSWIFQSGASAIRAEREKNTGPADRTSSMRISYGGSIGLDLGEEGFSYAGWTTSLGALDLSSLDSLCFTVRGHRGGEEFNVYLDDGTVRRPAAISQFGGVSKSWTRVSVPLSGFASRGVDLTHAAELQFVFEWKETSGTVWLDDVVFKARTQRPAAGRTPAEASR